MKTFLALIFFFCFNFLAFSQTGNISGYILFDNNTPALGASVVLKNSTFKIDISTNVNGQFRFNDISHGNYTLEIFSLDAKPKTVELTLQSEIKNLNIILERTEQQDLQEVLVQTKTEKRKIEDEGFAVNVIETKEAGLRNIQTNELLNTAVGVKIRQNGGLGSDVQYSLNGLSGSAVRIFIDGIPISVYGSSFSLNSIPPSMIKRIEVYKGVVPGHLADDALGGAINIVLHNSTKTNFNASVSYGSFNTFQTSINGLYRFDKSGFTVKASAFHNYSDNDYKVSGGKVKVTGLGGQETPITARRFNDAYKSTGVVAQIGFTDVKWADQFFIGFTGSDDYKEIQHGAFMTITPYKNRYMESDATLASLTYQKEDIFTKGLNINIHGLYGQRNRTVSDTLAWAYAWNGERAIDYKGDQYEYSWGSQQEKNEYGPILNFINRHVASLRSGVSYAINDHHKILINHVYSGINRKDKDEYAASLQNAFTGTRDLHKNISSFTYELNAFDGKFQGNVFAKYYQQKTINKDPYINQNTNQIENEIISSNVTNEGYGLAISYAIHPNITILTSTEKAIRLPNETEVFGNDGDNVIPNLSINPEQSKNYNLGFRLGTFSLNKHDLTISANVFTRNIKDKIGLPIETSLNVNEDVVLYTNQGQGTSKGIDAQFNYAYNKNFAINFNISKLDLTIENRGAKIDAPNTPFFTMNSNMRYSFKDLIQQNTQLNLFYTLYYTGEFSYLGLPKTNTIGDEFFKVPEQFAQDFGLSYAFPNKRFVLSFDIKNLFDKPLYDNLRVQKPGRAFYLKLNYSINKS